MINGKKLIAFAACILLMASMCVFADAGRSTSLSFDGRGNVVISRSAVTQKAASGNKGTWTVFVYLCGSDLETDNSAATTDIAEMISAKTKSNVRFVVQTGGAEEWQDYNISSRKNQRYLITGGKMTLVGETAADSMGDESTLESFLSWGLDNYASANNCLIMWNHGGGSISGVCFDEKDDYESLSLIEIDEALTAVHDRMPAKFAFIGFDACLMATIEAANMLVPHADYMIASEDIEPCCGWFYKTLGQYLSNNPYTSGKDLGIAIADAFYDGCQDSYGTEKDTTLSVIDLSKIDALIVELNKALSEMYEASADTKVLPVMVRGITSAKNFGGNSKTEGYTNMVDLGGILKSVEDYAPSAADAQRALADAVVYNKIGKNEKDATGLATYYPLSTNSSYELQVFSQICVSPYYMTFIDKITYGATHGTTTGYSREDEWLGSDSSWWGDDGAEQSSEDWSTYDNQSSGGAFLSSILQNYADSCSADDDYYDEDYVTAPIQYALEPTFFDNGAYAFWLTEESLDNLEGVYCSVMMIAEEGYLIDLGLDNYVSIDWDDGFVCDEFDGLWYVLPDEQVLAMYLIEEGDDYDLYTSPISLNGRDTNLRIKMEYTEDGYDTYMLGTNDGVSSGSYSSGRTRPLQRGDVIVPMYYVYDSDLEYAGVLYGDKYRFRGDCTIYDDYLPDGDYDYYFQIDDIYGNEYFTDSVTFNVEDGDVYFYY